MKKIRLEIPLDIWKDLPSHRIWMKVTENKIEAFEDRDCTKPVQKSENNVVLYVNVPKELSLIEVIGLGGLTPADDISMGFCMDEAEKVKVPGLKKVTILMENLVHEVPIIDGRPDRYEWEEFCRDSWLFGMKWAMEVYTLENKTVAAFHWHSDLIKEASMMVRKVHLSKRNKIPCMWEKGGLKSEEKGGSATIICQENGEKIKPLFVKKGKSCSCAEHALIAIRQGSIVIDAAYKKGHVDIEIWQVQYIHTEYCEAEMKYIASFSKFFYKNEKRAEIKRKIDNFYYYWNNGEVAEQYKDAILAAFDKATHYQCRAPHFVRDIT